MTTKSKIIIALFITVDIILVILCIGQVAAWPAIFSSISFFHPQGVIALQERNLLVTAVLIMLIAVIPVYFFLFFFVWKYRADKTDSKYTPNAQSNLLKGMLLWAIPAVIIFAIGVINWKSTHTLDPYKAISSTNKPITIQVIALPWKFLFIYPAQNIATVNFIEFPVNTPVNFELTADAPMSSFWIPQLGSQIYAMAGMETQMHLIANTTGDFAGKNTEINGDGFSGMKFVARSSSQNDFDQWVKSVRTGSSVLNEDAYNVLAAPSENNPPTYYATVDKDLYNGVMMKFMVPMENQSSSSMMDMPGMGQGANQ